ncbi:MAG: hypothetical protein K8T10_00115 [Candidatus Eremiobacteraeota bacterium]|nr:hypothetical protein [Candidatus Eremiobacteraeota bacterium]
MLHIEVMMMEPSAESCFSSRINEIIKATNRGTNINTGMAGMKLPAEKRRTATIIDTAILWIFSCLVSLALLISSPQDS